MFVPFAVLVVTAAVPVASAVPNSVEWTDCRGDEEGSEERGGIRPQVSGDVVTVDSEDGFFRVHYTLAGEDRVGADDADENGVPDDIDRTLAGLNEGRGLFQDLGYRALIPDDGLGGSTGLDVYVRDITAFGYAHPVESELLELPAHSCFMELDNALSGQGDGVLESVAVHELHHCIQYTYTPFAADWIYEATATFEQYRDRRSGPLDAALEFLWVFRLRDHALPLPTTGDRFEYAGFAFLKFWEELYNDEVPLSDARRVPDLWEAIAENPQWEEAFDVESRRVFDQSFGRTFTDFATWNLFACGRSDGAHYDAATFPCSLPATSVPTDPFPLDEAFQIVHEEVPYTATFFEMAPAEDTRPVELTCDGPGADAQLRIRLVALDALGARGEHADMTISGLEGGSVRLDGELRVGGTIALVAASTGEQPPQTQCNAVRVEPVVMPDGEEGCSCNNGDAPREGSAAAWMVLGWLALLRGRSPASRASSSR
jgi:hypothetical protein